MPVINISVENKIAEADGTLYVCDSSDFVAKFAFDAEWEAYENKTARFVYNNSYVDVVFTGNECPVPIISGTYFFNIGVYAGNLHTTTPARVPCKKSILCGSESESSASQEVKNKFLDVLDKRTALHRTSATMVTGISARPTPASHRAEQPARRATQVQPALLALLVRPARTARGARKATRANPARPEQTTR